MSKIDIEEGYDIGGIIELEGERLLSTEDEKDRTAIIKNIIELSKVIQEDNRLYHEMRKEDNRERELEIKESEAQDKKEIEDRKIEIEAKKVALEEERLNQEISSKKLNTWLKIFEIGLPIVAGASMSAISIAVANHNINKTMYFESQGNMIYPRDFTAKSSTRQIEKLFDKKISLK